MKRMLFNATQAEELRVAIVDGQKLIDLDIESAGKEQRKSNIYKGIITRIEPSLEAAFVDYGADRHGFLPFKEVSRSYFQPNVEPGRARIQDAMREGQEVIVQVDKDERGNKGAALTTYVSLAGRYLVLMPNNPRGGGVSRRVEGDDRSELREALSSLEVPDGMSMIARTAAIGRTAEELQWDLNYLLQLWRAIDGVAKEQRAPLLIYQEGSLVIRAIRDYFHSEIGEILIDTDDIYEQARAFMGQVMPPNVSRVKRYRDDVPLFSRFQIEHQIESAYSRQVNLPSGGAVVIDHTEALVAVDVNSGRATKGSDIEETALRTNLEAADELARQLRLRDLGGLIVIDFIDMESTKNQREVENRLRDALKYDRARVQMGKISRFGLMELSRQRLRPALAETNYITCPRCTGTGHIRSTESAALHILRILEEEAMKENTGAVHTQVPVDVATFLLNEKRNEIQAIEIRHKVNVLLIPNVNLDTPAHKIVRLRHDDLNQEERQLPSYRMAELAEEEEAVKPGAGEAGKPRQEAAIKQFSPEQPAPAAAEKAIEAEKPAAEASTGLIAKIMSWFRGAPKTEATPEAEKPAVRARGREGQGRGGRRGEGRREAEGSRRGRGDGARSEGARGETARTEAKAEVRSETRGEGQERREGARNEGRRQQPRREGAARNEDTREARGEARKERAERSERGAARAETPPAELVDESTVPASTAPAADGSQVGEDTGGRRRGRRGRRGERRQDSEGRMTEAAEGTATADAAQAADSSSEIVAATDAAPTVVVTAPVTSDVGSVAVVEASVAETVRGGDADETQASAEATASPEVIATEVTELEAPVANSTETEIEPQAAVGRPDVAQAAEPIVPAVAHAQPAEVAVQTIRVADLESSLQASGLVMVETDRSKQANVVVAEELAVPARHPRRPRPAVAAAANEPLVQVETRK